jgi:hypothetical protein
VTKPTSPAAGSPAAGEISALIAWMRRLSDTGPRQAGPAELAAFLHAKRDLLARIERCSPQPPPATPYGQSGDPR